MTGDCRRKTESSTISPRRTYSSKRILITALNRHDTLSVIDVKSQIKPEDKVFIKPNFVRVPSTSPYAKVKGAYEPTISPEGDIIHRDALEQLIVALQALRVHDITIGKTSGGCETPVVYKALALYELAEE